MVERGTSEHHRRKYITECAPAGAPDKCSAIVARTSFLRPFRARAFFNLKPVVFARSSLDHRLSSIVPSGHPLNDLPVFGMHTKSLEAVYALT